MKKLIIFVIIISTISCKKFVDIPSSPQLISNSQVFSNDNSALSAVTGVYVELRSASLSPLNGGITLYTALSSDELKNSASSTTYDPFFNNAILSNNVDINTRFWTAAYRNIYKCNAIIEGLTSSVNVSANTKTQIIGEVKVVRSIWFFYLLNLFGDIPLIITTDYTLNQTLPRTQSVRIYDQIVQDLKEAKSDLNTDYLSNGRFRPNKYTASAFLARVYLFRKDYNNANLESTEVINSGKYNLVPNLNDVFATSSEESIWEIASNSELTNTSEGRTFIPASSKNLPAFILSNSLLNDFEIGDGRKTSWIGSSLVSGTRYYYPYKYKSRLATPVTENEIIFRLAEQYLIRSEARVMNGDISGAVADINTLRNRARQKPVVTGDSVDPAWLPELSASLSQQAVYNAIQHERRIELFTEWGHRWLDLKRTGIIDEVMSIEKSSWKSYQALYPIPYSQILFNQQLTQNPGYTN